MPLGWARQSSAAVRSRPWRNAPLPGRPERRRRASTIIEGPTGSARAWSSGVIVDG